MGEFLRYANSFFKPDSKEVVDNLAQHVAEEVRRMEVGDVVIIKKKSNGWIHKIERMPDSPDGPCYQYLRQTNEDYYRID